MNKSNYKNTLDKIKASNEFKNATVNKLNHMIDQKSQKKKFNLRFKQRQIGILATCAIMIFCVLTIIPNITPDNNGRDIHGKITPDITEPDTSPPMTSVIINIEGKIISVSDDGKSFKLDTGLTVIITDETEIGLTGPNAPLQEDQYIEPSFRVGNSISAFTLDDISSKKVKATVIYTNWNWDNPNR